MSEASIDITVSEVGPRDCVQNIHRMMPTEAKIRWVAVLAAAGLREIEAGSFLSPKLVPQWRMPEDVVQAAVQLSGRRVLALGPKLNGANCAASAGVQTISMPLSASREHGMANVRMMPEQAVEKVAHVLALCGSLLRASRPSLEVGISTAFGCSLQGIVPEDWVMRLAATLAEAGAESIGLSGATREANSAPGATWSLREHRYGRPGLPGEIRRLLAARRHHRGSARGIALWFRRRCWITESVSLRLTKRENAAESAR